MQNQLKVLKLIFWRLFLIQDWLSDIAKELAQQFAKTEHVDWERTPKSFFQLCIEDNCLKQLAS